MPILRKVKLKGLVCLCVLFLIGCTAVSTPLDVSEEYSTAVDDRFVVRLNKIREKLRENKRDFTLLIQIRQMEAKGVNYFYQEGLAYMGEKLFTQAAASFQAGFSIVENHPKLLRAVAQLEKQQKAHNLYVEATSSYSSGQFSKAIAALTQAKKIAPMDQDIVDLHTKLVSASRNWKRNQNLVDLKFEDMDVKNALTFLTKTVGVSVVFDNSVKETSITLDIEDLPFVEAVELITSMTRNAYKVLDKKTLLIYANIKDRRQAYENILIKTFNLETMVAKDMASILKSAIGLKNITINEASNSLIIRDKPEIIQLAERIVIENDISPGEVVLDVEILEINLSDAERLGIDYGNFQISTGTPSLPIIGSIIDSYSSQTSLNIPSISLNAFKQAVNAKSLARPSIRVLDGEKAKIHIGDRVPLRKSSIQDATGQTRTTFEYQEIGIRFNVEAKIHSSRQVTVRLGLEVSSLGENLGTATEQAFRIGTRNAETVMLVNNGETAILGGLLREEERNTNSGINGLSDIPGLGKIFGSKDKSLAKTDLILTITPHIIRTPTKKGTDRALQAGTQNSLGKLSSNSPLDRLELTNRNAAEDTSKEEPPKVIINKKKSSNLGAAKAESSESLIKEETAVITKPSAKIIFDKRQYSGLVGETTTVDFFLDSDSLGSIKLTISTNENIAKIENYKVDSALWELNGDPTIEDGRLDLDLRFLGLPGQLSASPISIDLLGRRKGTSFIALKIEQAEDEQGDSLSFESKASRILIK